ncbi:glycosyltransferase [bacterium]|nr:glycosyltransferase [bacterium]
MTAINQLTPALHQNDAVGESILEIHRTIESWGHDSNIFSLTIDLPLKGTAREVNEFEKFDAESSVNILHFAVPSPLTNMLKASKGKKMLIYHNITPPDFFKGISNEMVHISTVGREELASLAGHVDYALGDSPFNEAELKGFGFEKTGVFPILLNPERYKIEKVKPLESLFGKDDFHNILFTGRITPNKRIEDVIRCFYYFKHNYFYDSRLFIIGNPAGFENYDRYLRELAERLELNEVYFTGKVDQDELVTYYSVSDLFITMSEHEGFCVPILESFMFDVPVVAYNGTAIPYTMGDGGILVNKKRYDEIAGIMAEVIKNKAFRDNIIKKQRKVLERFSPDKIKEKLRNALTVVM